MKKLRLKTSVYITFMIILILLLPVIDVLNNSIITIIYFIIEFLIINILHKRLI